MDAFWQQFAPWWERKQLASGQRRRKRATRLSPSEIMTILIVVQILFQQSGYRTFKGYYTEYVPRHLRAELLAFCLTPGTVDDRRPVPRLVRRLFGKLFDDKGYISQALAERRLVEHGLHLVTKARKNMRHRLLTVQDKLLLRKRAIIESVNDELQNVCQIEHTRHRSRYNFLAHLLAGLIAYCHLPKKPSLHLDRDLLALPAV